MTRKAICRMDYVPSSAPLLFTVEVAIGPFRVPEGPLRLAGRFIAG